MTQLSPISRAIAVFIIFFGLGIAHSWPLAPYVLKGIPYALDPIPNHELFPLQHGDHLQSYYHLGLLKNAAAGRIDWFTNPLEFVTEHESGDHPASYYFLPVSIISLPFSAVSEPLGYNMLLLICVALGGLSMYLWANLLIGNFWAGLFAGFLFNFIPVRMAELYGGHPAGLAIFLLPLTLYFFDRAIIEKRILFSALGGLALFALSFQYLYFSYYLLMFLMVYIPWRLVPAVVGSVNKGWDEVCKLAGASLPFAIGALSAIGWMYYYSRSVVASSAFSAKRTMNEVALFSPDISSAWSPQLDWKVYFGLPIIALLFGLIVGVVKVINRKPIGWEYLFFSILFVVSYILAFGATLDRYIPLYSLFYDYFPYFDLSRSPSKIMALCAALLAVLGAYFVSWAWRRAGGGFIWRSVVALLAAITIIDYHPNGGIGICLLDRGNKIYKQIAETSDGGYVLNLPIWPGDSSWESIYQYYALQSGVAMVNGYSPVVSKSYVDNVFWKLFTMNSGNVTKEQINFLKDKNVKAIVFHEEAYPNKVSPFPASVALNRLKSSALLDMVGQDGPLTLFRISDSEQAKNDRPVSSPMSALYQAEALIKIDGKVMEDDDAVNDLALYGAGAMRRTGFLGAGPYQSFPSGSYNAVFRAKVADNTIDELAVLFDVSANSGRDVLAKLAIKNSDFVEPDKYQEFALPFEVVAEKSTKIEFRSALPESSAGVYVDWIYVTFADQTDPEYSYEIEDFFHIGATVEDQMASAGKSLYAHPDQDPAGMIAHGPMRKLEEGAYIAYFRMKADMVEADSRVAVLEVASAGRSETIAQRDVMGRELGGSSGYIEASIDFLLEETDFIDFRVRFTGATALYLDKIRIEKK